MNAQKNVPLVTEKPKEADDFVWKRTSEGLVKVPRENVIPSKRMEEWKSGRGKCLVSFIINLLKVC